MSKIKRFVKITGIVLCCALLVLCISLPAAKPIIEQAKVRVIIDPGHGIPDGGAIGLDGTNEQTLNLQIARKLYALFPDGSAVMTRENENGIYVGEGTIRAKKISDMNERVKIANKYSEALYVSIHMNTYPGESVHGCQVFYREGNEQAKSIAETLQQTINANLQPDNPKSIKTISKSLYLFKNTENPALLIECGFITNSNDLKKLKDESFQKRLAEMIFKSIE